MSRRLLHPLKRKLEQHDLFDLARGIRWFIREHASRRESSRVLSIAPDRPAGGRALVSFRAAFTEFSRGRDQPASNAHNNYWEARQMVETLLEFGYCVDVIDHLNTTFVPYEPYSIVIDARSNLERLAPLLHGHCVKVMHLDTAHFLFHNAAEARRLLDLQRRRGVALGPRRFEAANLGIETADCGTTSGNEWTISTFRYARKPIYRLPVPAAASFAWREDKDWEKCRRQFLWLNGRGLVHKGLDLVLEAFAAMPEYHLTVCGPLDEEKDFTRVYHEELYETPNIHPVGWIDVTGPEFSAIAANCMGTVLASCSENASGSAVNCMHAGLVPIVSRECGVDVDDFGVLLNDCSVENIKNTVRSVASRPADEIKDRARAAWEFARANHTRARYAETYREVVARILGHQEARAIQFLPGIMRSA